MAAYGFDFRDPGADDEALAMPAAGADNMFLKLLANYCLNKNVVLDLAANTNAGD